MVKRLWMSVPHALRHPRMEHCFRKPAAKMLAFTKTEDQEARTEGHRARLHHTPASHPPKHPGLPDRKDRDRTQAADRFLPATSTSEKKVQTPRAEKSAVPHYDRRNQPEHCRSEVPVPCGKHARAVDAP